MSALPAFMAAMRARLCGSHFHLIVPIVVLSACLSGCGGGGGSGSSPSPDVTITAQPADTHVVEGQSANFAVSVNGSATYEWQKQGGDGWTAVPGATNARLSVGPVAMSDSGTQYRVVVASTANSANRVTSSAATLTVDRLVVAPAIQSAPANQGVYEGQTVPMSVTATGTALRYQWQVSRDKTATWSDIEGATEATYTFDATLADDQSEYRVVISNEAGSQTSVPAVVDVAPAPALPTFVLIPFGDAVTVGGQLTLNAQAVGSPAPSIVWQSSYGDNGTWSDIPGATGGTYTLENVTAADDGRQIRAVATNENGSDYTTAVRVSVSIGPTAAGISEQPHDATAGVGYAATFEAYGYGSPAVSYQWQVSADHGATFTNINGATHSTYTTGVNALSDSGKMYRAVASNDLGSATTQAALLTVMTPPTIMSLGYGQYWRPGATDASLVVVATGESLSYQWQIGTTDWPNSSAMHDVSGATAKTFVLPASTPSSVNSVCVSVSNPVGVTATCSDVFALTWHTVDPEPTAASLSAVARIDGQTAVASTSNGSMLLSTDSGRTWKTTSEGAAGETGQRAIGISGQNGIAVGEYYGSQLSFDAGQHWAQGPSLGMRVGGVAFAPDGVATAVGENGSIRLSSDGGISWTDAVSDTNTNDLDDVAFNASGIGIAVGQAGTVRRSSDAGRTWTTVHLGGSEMLTVAFAPDGTIVAGDRDGQFWRSTDGGLNWTSVSSGSTYAIARLRFSPSGVGVASTYYGNILRTTDDGLHWSSVSSSSPIVEDFAFLDDGVALAAGWGMRRSSDDSQTWQPVGSGSTETLVAAAPVDASTAVAVGTNGTIRRTIDGGATWTTVPSGVSVELTSVAFSGANGIAVGEAGTVLLTNDGGQTWTSVNTGVNDLLWSVSYASPSVVVVAGKAEMLRSTTGGLTWTSVPGFDPSTGFASVSFGDASTGVALAFDGNVWRTVDAGATWTRTASSSPALYRVAFASPTTVVAIGTNNELRSIDGGMTWSTLSAPDACTGLAFRDANVGFAVGHKVYETTDGGVSWVEQTGAQQQPLNAVMPLGAHTVVGVGEWGLIYESDGY